MFVGRAADMSIEFVSFSEVTSSFGAALLR